MSGWGQLLRRVDFLSPQIVSQINDIMGTESGPVLMSLEQLQSSPTATTVVTQDKSARRLTKSSKKRARVACLHCRRRKVRCDVSPHGAPCTNCRLDNIHDCAPCDRRGRGSVLPRPAAVNLELQKKVPEQPLLSPRESACTFEDPAVPHGNAARHSEYCTDSPSSSGQQAQVSVEDEVIAYQSIDNPSLGVAVGDIEPLRLWSAPSFVTYDLSGISNEDIAYLQNKGCFDFPDKHILDELLPYYFDYIHPHMPFIDETEFWYMYRTHYNNTEAPLDSSQPSFSLLLFQAILFAATTCAPMSLLRSLGYTSRSKARRHAFFRVRALYSLDIERDNLVLVQTFLLMSYWNGEVGEDKDGWHWVGLAVSLALHLGLHRQPSSKSTLTQRQQTIRKRCWWGCVVRDRLVALSQHRKPRIQLKESDVEILTLADYNVGLRSGMSNLSSAEELGKRTAMSMFSVQLIRLVLCVERDSDLFNEQAHTSSPTSPPETWSRKQTAPLDDGLMIGHAGLDSWRLNLPEVLQLSTCPDADESILPCILVHRNVLQIYYHKLILSMVTRLLWPTRVSMGQASRDMQLAHTSTLALVKLHNNLVDHDAIHCIPGSYFDAAFFTRFDAKLQTPPAEVCPLQTRPPSKKATQIQSPISSELFNANLYYQPDINRNHRTNMMTLCDYFNRLDGDQPLLDLTIPGASCPDEPLFPGLEGVGELDSITPEGGKTMSFVNSQL
ncbi:hypothetical protein FOVG_11405 [Fusarium oxysporum f. sp. pisi HDV247]|uniref:Zn(2)-C6 fungal-type domain-containing protein n=1 Tax=Fusarium oxysporum f. sp. pisi HDV247 TaxID=1080344 RepID=W9NWE5_FUSOX|nr:hypothetical protein FOVG_11405 [Fusarium oxysporum f. sp. pisi HDV247]